MRSIIFADFIGEPSEQSVMRKRTLEQGPPSASLKIWLSVRQQILVQDVDLIGVSV
jgi:hypothetical protein